MLTTLAAVVRTVRRLVGKRPLPRCPRCNADEWRQSGGVTWCLSCRFWYEGYASPRDHFANNEVRRDSAAPGGNDGH